MLEVRKFSAKWCGSCSLLNSSVWPRLQETYTDVTFVSIDTDLEPGQTSSFNIKALPTVVFIKDGLEAYRIVGMQLLAAYTSAIDRLK